MAVTTQDIATQLEAINACLLMAEASEDLADAIERMKQLKTEILNDFINKGNK